MNEANIQTGSVMTALLSSSKLKENLTELHIIVRTTGLIKAFDFHFGYKKLEKVDNVSRNCWKSVF